LNPSSLIPHPESLILESLILESLILESPIRESLNPSGESRGPTIKTLEPETDRPIGSSDPGPRIPSRERER
jgi:hypothetical protein